MVDEGSAVLGLGGVEVGLEEIDRAIVLPAVREV